MKSLLPILVLPALLSLAACDKPTVVNVPAPVAVPGPSGPAGPTGAEGNKGEAGKPGEGTTVIVQPSPPASAASANP